MGKIKEAILLFKNFFALEEEQAETPPKNNVFGWCNTCGRVTIPSEEDIINGEPITIEVDLKTNTFIHIGCGELVTIFDQ